MTKPVTRKMAVDCLLDRIQRQFGEPLRCVVCGEPVLPGQAIQFDHIHCDVLGGAHEYQNLRPIHYDPCHKKKSGRDAAAKAKVDRITGKTKMGPKAKISNRPMGKRPPGSGNGFPPRGSTPMRRKS